MHKMKTCLLGHSNFTIKMTIRQLNITKVRMLKSNQTVYK